MATIKHVQGNLLRASIPLQINIVSESDGVVTQATQDFTPNADYPTTIMLRRGSTRYAFTASVDGNVASFEDAGTLPVGSYNVEVLCRDTDAQPMRYMVRDIIEIVDATIDADIEAGVEFDSETYTLDGAVFIAFTATVTGITEETDPVFSASPAAGITASDIENWNNGLTASVNNEILTLS